MRWVAAAVLVISESQELKQGVADLLLLVLSPLDVDKSFSFYPRTVGSRAPRLHPGGVCCGQLYAWTVAPEAGLSLRPQSPLVSARPVPMHQGGQCASAQCQGPSSNVKLGV